MVKQGAYYENVKTHKFTQHTAPELGFPARGIQQYLGTPTDRPGNWVDYHLWEGVVSLPSYVRDTKDFLQQITQLNESGSITNDMKFMALDIEKMYPMMPGELSDRGVKTYIDSHEKPHDSSEPFVSTDSVMHVMHMCQESNFMEFKSDTYRQKSGGAIGQRQSPDVACLGAGVAECVEMNSPRDILYKDTPHIMRRPTDDPMFWSVKDIIASWMIYIDDVLTLIKDDKKKAEFVTNKLNKLHPGKLVFSCEFSEITVNYLNLKLILNREKKILETDHFVKPTNARTYLHYSSNHPEHIFKSVVFSQALTVFMCCSRPEWAENALAQLRQSFVAQDYPCSIIDAQFARVLQLNRRDVIFHVKTVKPTSKYKSGLLVTYHKNNPPYRNWIDQAARETLYSDPYLNRCFLKSQ